MEALLREWTLKLLAFLGTFLFIWSAIAFSGIIFQWSGFTKQIQSSFGFAGFSSLVIIFTLTMVNIATNLNIISRTQEIKTDRIRTPEIPGQFISLSKILFLSVGIVLLIISGLWFVEWQGYKNKADSLREYGEFISQQRDLLNAAAAIIYDEDTHSYTELRDILETFEIICDGNEVSLIVRKDIFGYKKYVMLTKNYLSSSYSDRGLLKRIRNIYKPTGRERERFDLITEGDKNDFSVLSEYGDKVLYFRRFTLHSGELIVKISAQRQSDFTAISPNIIE